MSHHNRFRSLRAARPLRRWATTIVAMAVVIALPAPAVTVTGVLTATHGDRHDGNREGWRVTFRLRYRDRRCTLVVRVSDARGSGR